MKEVSNIISEVNTVTWIQVGILAIQVVIAVIFGLVGYYKCFISNFSRAICSALPRSESLISFGGHI